MWWQFFLQDIHFIVHVFAALAFLAIGWLHFDAWTGHHAKKELWKWTGFAALAVSFIVQATTIEQAVLGQSLFGGAADWLIYGLRIIGFGLLVVGQLLDPLQKVPENKGIDLEDIGLKRQSSAAADPTEQTAGNGSTAQHAVMLTGATLTGLKWLAPLGGFGVAWLYWRRATTGLERHLKRMAYGFALVGLADLIELASLLRDTTNPIIYSWVAPFGWVWIVGHLVLLAGIIYLSTWVWGYLTKRFFSQFFMVFTVIAVVAFFAVSVSITSLLLRSVRSDALKNLTTAAQVLQYAISAKQAETMAGAQQLAASDEVVRAVKERDHAALAAYTAEYLAEKKQTSLIITTQTGQVLLRGQETERWGDGLSSDTLVRRALSGQQLSSIAAQEGVGAPTLLARSAVPVKAADGSIIGTVQTGIELGIGFVDGIRQATGLESSLYAGNVLSATTATTADGKSRNVGSTLTHRAVTTNVLTRAQTFAGTLKVQNRELMAVFVPLKDVDAAVVGMLQVSQPQGVILQTAGRSIEVTFLLTIGMLVLALLPIYFVTRAIERQLE